MNDIKWNYDSPKGCGYYLATWKFKGDGRSRRVSEFWFDGMDWWTGRKYIHAPDEDSLCGTFEESLCITEWIIAWMDMPKYARNE